MNENAGYALVTGGTSGIGYELVKLLAKDGFNLVIVARDENELQSVAHAIIRQYSVDVLTLSKDLFQPESALAVFDEVQRAGIRVDVLINNAGQGHYGKFVDTELQKELDIIQLNISSLVVLTKLFLREMTGRGAGKILNVSSIASKTPGPWQSVYHGTKAFVQSFTEAIRNEVKDSGVTITALLPGATDTDFFNKAEMQDAKIVKEGKLDDAEQVARDGYTALMSGEDSVVSGFKNKVQVAMGAITSDERLADKTRKSQEPVSKNK